MLPLLLLTLAADRPDVLFADFEGDAYAPWTATGTAFGPGPASGSLPGQMHVSGFVGKRLVNSFAGGDRSVGTLTSPEFTVNRRHIAFRIGGGGFAGKTCLNLVIDGKTVRTAVGPNTQPGGSEELEPAAWDVAEFDGKSARLVVVDQATGGWGHINVDHIMFTDAKPVLPVKDAARQLTADKRYLHVPIKNGAAKRRVVVEHGGKMVREFTAELADGPPDWWAPLDVSAWKGQTLTVKVDKLPAGSKALEQISTDDQFRNVGELYREPLRPQLRFSSRRGWLNDPNGMVFADGEWHLFYQHNPYGTEWGNMHWGHAVSRDLAHWQELPIAFYPPTHDDMAFSGSAVVDRDNTSGWKKGDNELLVAAFTSTGRGECIAYSTDRGRTWTEYEKNPVVKHEGRDPRLLWHKPSKQWVMALYDEAEKKRWITFHTSPDLKTWTYRSRIEGFFECPDLFELPVDGDPKKTLWVLTAADSDYVLGAFDGALFTPTSKKLKGNVGKGFYAAQTFSDAPDGRVIQVGWMQAKSPGMSFNQSMSVPQELRLVTTPDGPRLTRTSVPELHVLRGPAKTFGPMELKTDAGLLDGVTGEQFEIHADLIPAEKGTVTLTVRGVPIRYDAAKQELSVAGHKTSVPLAGGKLSLTVFADRTVFEVFAQNGLVYLPLPVVPAADARGVAVAGNGRAEGITVYPLGSVWGK